MFACLCSRIIPLVHLTQWIPKDQQHERSREGGAETKRRRMKAFTLNCNNTSTLKEQLRPDTYCPNLFISEWASPECKN